MPAKPKLYLSGDKRADTLLAKDPLALLIGLVLDQQVPLERAFSAPADLEDRLGGPLDAGRIAAMSPEDLAAVFSARPALHRFPASMAGRVQELCRHLIANYGGDAAAVWKRASTGAELLANVRALPGFGEQKARIFVAFLGKQLGVRPPGWERAAGSFAEPGTHMSIADIDSPEALLAVREHKRAMKAAAKSVAAAPAPPAAPPARRRRAKGA